MLQHPEYKLLKQNFMHGWRTWNVRSVLSHVHMPDGLALNIGLKEYRGGAYLKETLIGRFPTSKTHNDNETAYPGMHAYDDSYTEMRVTWQDFDFKVESTVDDGELILLVTPAQLNLTCHADAGVRLSVESAGLGGAQRKWPRGAWAGRRY